MLFVTEADETATETGRQGGIDSDFQVKVDDSGKISYPEPIPVEVSAGKAEDFSAAAANECDDTTYAKLGFKEHGTYEWHLNPANAAAGMNAASAKSAIVASLNHVKNVTNNCGYSDTVDAVSEYQSDVTNRANFTSTGCGTRDGQSVWDFGGKINSEKVAATCQWIADGDLLEADTRFNTDVFNFTTDGTSVACSEKYDVQSIATHESGHIFGLADLPDGHDNLTMYHKASQCSIKRRSLGAGDVLGMQSLY
jgi:hypothetical protein